ncbi:hypothetical protein [Amycolatopsis orientalis]|uniref:hypothetical protein n=1 Tax=Amycolatopsis orientalis TaxID=31958 RepID=UPI001268BE19|nr:hypothetical protein [Amycolatopsis orientalis]
MRGPRPHVDGLGLPGEEEYLARLAGGDRCTSINLTPALWHAMASDTPRLKRSSLYVDGRLDLAHQQLLAATRAPDADCAVTEVLIGLVAKIVRQAVVTTLPDCDRVCTGERTLVAQARSLTGDGHPASAGLAPSPPC